jgi:hypothetical protein
VRRKGEGCGWAKQSFGPRKTPSPITQNKGGAKVNMNSSLKKPFVTLEYNKGKDKFLTLFKGVQWTMIPYQFP